jgi:hypothetical protein
MISLAIAPLTFFALVTVGFQLVAGVAMVWVLWRWVKTRRRP